MADYDLTQTGQEVQDILDGAAMQTDLTAETERAELAEQTLQGGIDAEETRAKAAEKQNADDIDVIESKIPAGASDQNQLADKEFVNNSIATATATYRGAYNLVNDLSLTVGATHEQIATALAGAISTADNNDYCFVQIPTADATPTQIASIERYKFNGTAWAYEYTLNNSGFTAAQWAALNSGITSGLVAKLLALPTNEALALTLAGKQDVLTFDSVPVDGSNNPVKSGGVYSAIGDEETRAKAAEKANADDIDDIEALIPATASDENQLADKQYVNDGIATASATYRGSFNEVNDLSLTTDATHEQIATALAGAISTADNNDYCFVQIPTSDAAPTQIASIERYKFNGTAWAYEYTLNNSGFTAAQWAALNSGITSGLVAKLSALPTNDALTLALAGKQDVLTFDNEPTSGSNNPVKSGGVYDAIDAEATTRAAAIAAIVALIPEAASALNQLADKAFVNSSISTATAVFKGTFNVVVDLELSYNATQEQIATMLASKIISADNNDYCFVQIPTSDAAPLQIARTDRYKFNGTAWAYEYTLNNSGFTTAQWAAINSGITSLLKDKLIDLPTATELTALLAAKQNQLTFDTTPTTGSTNPVTSGGIKSAIDAEKARAEAAEADRYTKSETYNKTEINGMVSTPHQNYVTVPTYASLPSSGQSTDTIYRVSSYDGANNQVDDTVYSEYAWDGTQYVFLRVNSQIEEVFDITVYNNNTKYADLSAALGVDGANIPATLRRGGMSVKFVQSSDNKYVQYRLMSDTFNTDVANWQGVDDAPTAGSKNLVESGSVFDLLVGTVKFIDGTQEAWNVLIGFAKDIYVIGADTAKTVSISYVYKNTEGNEGKFCLQLAYFLPNNNTELRKNFYVPGSTAGNTLIQMTDETENSGIEVFIRTQNSPVFDSASFIQPTDFHILKTGFGENIIPFVIDYINKNRKDSVVVDANNYSSVLPDMNQAKDGIVYRLLFSSITTNLPTHLPFSSWGNNGLASCVRFGNSTYSTMLLITQAGIYYRILGAEWSDWETLTPIKEVTVGTGGNFSSLLAALKYTSDKTPIRILRNTTIDVEQEYISNYGADFWTNYDGYDNHSNDMMYRGIWLGKGRELYGEENATIVFNYSGSNQNVKEHFSLLAVAGDNYIHDLTIYPSANNCEYHIHDDWQTGTMESTQIKYERLIFKGSSYSNICIGAGIGNNCSYIIKDCLFLCNEAANYNVSYHGCTSGNENAKGRIYVTGCYGLGQLVFRSYGVSTQLTDCVVSNCKFSKIDCLLYPGQVNENMRLIAFNNTETGIS